MSNQQIFDESKKYMPGGVNSPVRAYRDMGIISSSYEVRKRCNNKGRRWK